jgi:hypothetical protein
MDKNWTVYIADEKQATSLPQAIEKSLIALITRMEVMGPVRGEWPNYSKLTKNRHHCHLKKRSKPTWVAVWKVVDNDDKIIEITYVGTREKAPY